MNIIWTSFLLFADVLVLASYPLLASRVMVRTTGRKLLTSPKRKAILLVHVVGGMAIWACGWWAPTFLAARRAMAWTTLLIHVPTSALMIPRVWGVRYITATGYALVVSCMAVEAFRVALADEPDRAWHLWVLHHTAFLVRWVAICVSPFSKARFGDLATQPFVHSATLAAAVMTIMPMVYGPWANPCVLAVIAAAKATCHWMTKKADLDSRRRAHAWRHGSRSPPRRIFDTRVS